MSRPANVRHTSEVFAEKDFYLEEFRGRSVVVAVAPEVANARGNFDPLAGAVADLARNDTRVLLWWSAPGPADRRIQAVLARALARGRRATARPPAPPMHVAPAALADDRAGDLRAQLWGKLRRERVCLLVADAVSGPTYAQAPAVLAASLRIPKLVLVDAGGGLLGAAPGRLSFVDENVLDTLLHEGQAEWSGLGDRRPLLVAVREALQAGVEAVNLCTLEGVAEELFTYVGSGTLFTRGDYCHVGPLALDDFAQAERLLERGQREGLLKVRSPDQIAELLGVGFGATLCDRHLAGVAGLLTAPYAAERAGEIVGLYTITRFKGEGIGERLVTRLVAEAGALGLEYVFACAVDERAVQFFARLDFELVPGDAVPAVKWVGYDAKRRTRVAVLKRRLGPGAAAPST
jgi:amino-acid N-acetyltransferase